MTYKQYIANLIYDNYKLVFELGRNIECGGSTYSSTLAKNGVGCAIGCLLPPALADQLHDINEKYHSWDIYELLKHGVMWTTVTENDHNTLVKIKDLLNPQSDDDLIALSELQNLHDGSNSYNEFMSRLEKEL